MFQKLTRFSDLGILLVRLMVAVVFIDSGWKDLLDLVHRSVSIGMSQHFTVFSGSSGDRRRTRSCFRTFHPTRCYGTDRCQLRCSREEDFRLAHWILGRQKLRVAL